MRFKSWNLFKSAVLSPLLILAVIFAVSCASSDEDDKKINFGELFGSVRVVVSDADGLKILSKNPAEIGIGKDVEIEFELEDGVVIESVSHGELQGNKIILSDVYFSTVVRIKTRRLLVCNMSVTSIDETLGKVVSSVDYTDGNLYEGEQISMSAVPKNGAVFAGYSAGAPIEDGGTFMSGDVHYTFTVTESLKIYANFYIPKDGPTSSVIVPEGKWVLLYHPNGGAIAKNSSSEMMTTYFDNTYYLCPNTLPNDGSFVREGYVLMGYNTEEDGSGTFYGPGWNVIMPEKGAISLYCVWAPVTPDSDFKTSLSSDKKSVIIESYIGKNEKLVVIPEKIGSLPVETIKAGAFKDANAIEEIYISRSVKTIESNAITNCPEFKTLYFCDSVLKVNNDSVSNCSKFKKLCMLATRYPMYANTRNGNFCIKFERLITVKGPKLIMASGSNSAFGIDSALFEQLLAENGYNYSLVNYGTNASANITFFLEVISHYINEGDIVIQAPEPAHKSQWGTTIFTSHIWQMFEGAYEAISLVDISSYSEVFKTYSDFANARKNNAGMSYEAYSSETINYYGDMVGPRIGHSSSYKKNYIDKYLAQGGYGEVSYKDTISYIGGNAWKLNYFIDLIESKGGTCLLTFGTANYICLTQESQIAGGELQTQLESTVDQMIHAKRISSVATYSMDYEWFHETNFHLTTAGAERRTRLLMDDLLKYFKTAG